jgi:hypothetical protein
MDKDRLKGCPEEVRAFYRYWDGKRRGRLMPARADIEPGEIKAFLPSLMIVDKVADDRRYVYRLVGTREAEIRGFDPTGKSVPEAASGGAEAAVANYDKVVRTRDLLVDASEAVSPDERYRDIVCIFLPLSDDGETVNKILVYTHQVRQF